jgi:hypothetical protein
MSSNDHYDVIVKNVVLHILDTNAGAPVFSSKEIDPDSEGFNFVTSLVQKMLADDNGKNAYFLEGSNRVKDLCQNLQSGEADFLAVTRQMAAAIHEIMANQPGIPPADLVCCQVVINDTPNLGLLKLNYRTNYIHYVEYEGETNFE